MSNELATITIRYKDAPGEGKKNWKIKGDGKTAYSISPELAAQVNVGDTVDLTYEPKVFNGFPVNMVKTLSHGGRAPVAPSIPEQRHTQQPAPSQPSPAPRTGNGHSQEFRTPRQMFVSDVLAGAASGGDVSEEGVRKLTAVLCSVWDEFLA